MRKYCGKIDYNDVGKSIIIYGWVSKFKNLGRLIFLHVRDREGIIQVIFNHKRLELFKLAKTLTNESCVKVIGLVIHKNNTSADIEIIASYLKVINYSYPIPLDLMSNYNKEETILKYRYLYLRRQEHLMPLKIRSKVILLIHQFMQRYGFLHIETPILTKSTPEGARDYLVPSRINKKKFFALPQSPQLFKQILMISGIDKYYQIVKCFRDEDLRINRQPEFTQLDVEASFMSSKALIIIMEKMIKCIWKKILSIKLDKFPVIKFNEALQKYGSDKPDLRNPIIMGDIKKYLKKYNINNIFNSFKGGDKVLFMQIPLSASKIDNNFLNYYKDILLKREDIIDFCWVKISNNLDQKEFSITEINRKNIICYFLEEIKANPLDILFLFQGTELLRQTTLANVRSDIANRFNLIDNKKDSFVWIVDFPLFKRNINTNYLESVHHPFTAPKNNLINLKALKKEPLNVISDSYDLILNGEELGGGSVRINNKDMQKKIFDILNINNIEQNEKFGFFLEALKYGAPLHAGIAFGLDRLIMLLTRCRNIKDVIAFPKTNRGNCLLTNAPTTIDNNILSELNIKIK